jgi:hypothetical protein
MIFPRVPGKPVDSERLAPRVPNLEFNLTFPHTDITAANSVVSTALAITGNAEGIDSLPISGSFDCYNSGES